MSSLTAARVGAEQPTILRRPPGVHSLDGAREAVDLADAYGVCDGFPLAPSQRAVLEAALGERPDGSWAASRVGHFGPRQGTGKSDVIAARELAGLVLFGEQLIIHTAHEFPTANESFLRLVAVFENFDDLRRRVQRVRYANGEQGIELVSGQRLKYRARTGGSGRGFAQADLIVYDEAQHLLREHVAASGPARMANPNSQTWYAGSGGLSVSVVAWQMRRDAVLGLGDRLAYAESTAETVRVDQGKVVTGRPDPHDRDAWYAAIPGLGRWVTEESVEGLLEELGPDLFARECLCVWDPEPVSESGGDLDAGRWAALVDLAEQPRPPLVFGVDQGEDRLVSIAVAWRRADGGVQVMLDQDDRVSSGLSPAAAVDRLGVLHGRYAGRVVLGGPATGLERELEAAGVPTEAASNTEFASATGRLVDLIAAGGLWHGNQEPLTAAVRVARLRRVGQAGERALSLKDAPGVGPLAAVLRAVHGLSADVAVEETIW